MNITHAVFTPRISFTGRIREGCVSLAFCCSAGASCVSLVLAVCSLQPYLWSTAAVASYSFVLGDDHYQGMVAVWDLLNHITGAVNVRLNHDADRGVLQVGRGVGGRFEEQGSVLYASIPATCSRHSYWL